MVEKTWQEMTPGEHLQYLRRSTDLTVRDFATATGYGVADLFGWEFDLKRGENPLTQEYVSLIHQYVSYIGFRGKSLPENPWSGCESVEDIAKKYEEYGIKEMTGPQQTSVSDIRDTLHRQFVNSLRESYEAFWGVKAEKEMRAAGGLHRMHQNGILDCSWVPDSDLLTKFRTHLSHKMGDIGMEQGLLIQGRWSDLQAARELYGLPFSVLVQSYRCNEGCARANYLSFGAATNLITRAERGFTLRPDQAHDLIWGIAFRHMLKGPQIEELWKAHEALGGQRYNDNSVITTWRL